MTLDASEAGTAALKSNKQLVAANKLDTLSVFPGSA